MSKSSFDRIAVAARPLMTRLPHAGGEYPGSPKDQIRPVYRGPARPEGTRITNAPAQRLDWSHDGGPDDIVAYEVVHKVRD